MNRLLLGSLVALAMAATACSAVAHTSTDPPAASEVPSTTSAATDPSSLVEPPSDPAATSTGAPSTDARSRFALDDRFGAAGLVAAPQSAAEDDRFITVAEGADGTIYTAGFTSTGEDRAVAVSRYFADGAPDETFGVGGTAVVDIVPGGGGAEVGRGLVVQDDGSVVVAGPFEKDPAAAGDAARDLDIAVIRLDPTGALDPSFGDGGIAKIDLGAGKAVDAETYLTDNVWGLTTRAGGYAISAVTPNQATDRTDTDYAIVGLSPTGALDRSFGVDGTVIVDLAASRDTARNIGTTADGSIVATGYSRDGDGIVSPVLIKVSATGVLDPTFGTDGVANHTILDGVAESYQWVAQGDDHILAGYGRGSDSETVDLIVYRFRADGTWDESFGTDGVTRVDIAGEDDRGRNVTILPDGNILVVGSGKDGAEEVDGLAVMLDADGAPVSTFGDDGHLLVDLGGPADAFFGVTVTADERTALLAGFKGAEPDGTDDDDAVLARIAL